MAQSEYSFLPFGAVGLPGIAAPRWYYGTAIPTAGTYNVGDTLFNITPGAASAEITRSTTGWVCTTAGTPGTWQAIISSAAAQELVTTATSGAIAAGFRVVLLNPATTGTYTLPDCTTVLPSTLLTIKNIASGSTTLAAIASNSYADAAAITLAQNAFVTLNATGASTFWYKVG